MQTLAAVPVASVRRRDVRSSLSLLLRWISSSLGPWDSAQIGRLGRHPRHLPLQHLGDHGHGDGLPVASKSYITAF